MKTDVLIIGGGPAGLSAGLTARSLGLDVTVIDENPKIGGQLIKQTHKFFGSKQHWCGVRGIDIADKLLKLAEQEGVKIFSNTSAVGIFAEGEKKLVGMVKSSGDDEEYIPVEVKGVVLATGASENMLLFENNDLPGIYGAGAVQTLVNVYGVRPGNKILMVGSGNIGIIVSYQLMQAGIQVVGILEALPAIGSYSVHSAKVLRLGIPIYTSHTIKSALGENEVEGAIVVKLDSQWKEIPGTERKIDCDVICLATGLTPSTELLQQAGCKMSYIPELGGWIPYHNNQMQTSLDWIYVAGMSQVLRKP